MKNFKVKVVEYLNFATTTNHHKASYILMTDLFQELITKW